MDATGRCLCGAVRFTAHGVEPHFHACQCRMCQRWGGGPAFAAETKGVDFEQDETLARFASSAWAERLFCSRCGSNLFYFLKPADRYMVWIGALDDPEAFELDGEIFVDEPRARFEFAGDHPRQTAAEVIAASGVEVPEGE